MEADEDTVPLNVRLPRRLHGRVKAKAALRGQTIREYVTEALTERVEHDDDEDRRTGRGR